MPKLTETAVLAILASPHTDRFVAEVHGVSRATIRDVRTGRSWKRLHAVAAASDAIDREGYAEMVRLQRQRAARRTSPLTAALVMEIRRSTESQAALARRLGIARGTVQNVQAGRTWGDVREHESAATQPRNGAP
jgi:DNA-binding transcriptional regulator YiaG